MTIVQFISAMERYSMDVLAIAFLVCLITSLLKKGIPKKYKKYITFLPFVVGVAAYGGYLYINKTAIDEILSARTVLKGIECGAAATIYYVLYEQFIRGKRPDPQSDIRTVTVRALIREHVRDSALDAVAKHIAASVTGDDDYSLSLCINTISGKTKPGVSEMDIALISKLIVKTLQAV